MRTLPLLALSLVATGLGLATASPAGAAGETCQGRAATIVGQPYQYGLTGTDGADVIVTNGASSTNALGGDDLVCITGPASGLSSSVDAGAGNDVVDASGAPGRVDVQLGAGSDTYTGSRLDESVNGGGRDASTGRILDTERDVITTGSGGDDGVTSGSDPDLPNADVVVLGADDGVGFGNGVGWTGPLAPGGRLDGAGGAGLYLTVGTGDVVIDARAGTLAEDGTTLLTWTGFDRFRTGGTGAPAPATFTFLGSERDEEVDLRFEDANDHLQRIDLAGGDDALSLGYDDNVGKQGSRYDGGPGTDDLKMWAGRRLDLDLASGRMRTSHDGRTVRTRMKNFETELVGAKKLVLKGTKKADELLFYACDATVRGRGGADTIMQSRGNDYFEAGLRCNPRSFRLYGDGGNDTLKGSRGRDLLVGGKGRDTLSGNAGRDRCSGEKLSSCEVTLR